MAWNPPSHSELRGKIKFQRRTVIDDGMGNTEGPWADLVAPQFAKVVARRGGEKVIADRLAGVSETEIVVRRNPKTALVRSYDRAVDCRTLVNGQVVAGVTRTFNIRWVGDIEDRGRWIVMHAEEGVADG